MDKIYRRPTQLGDTPKKKKNEKNRKRNKIINFRVSQEEKDLIEVRLALSGLTRAEFFIESCLYQTILVKGNIRSFTEIRNWLIKIADVMEQKPDISGLDREKIWALKTIIEILDSRFKKEKAPE